MPTVRMSTLMYVIQQDAIADNSDSLGKADEVFVISGGNAVDVAEAQAIQGLAGYQTGASEYEIEDNAAALISAVTVY